MDEKQLSIWGRPAGIGGKDKSPAAARTLEDDDARRMIETGVDRSCAIEASAGTGKTSLLVKRIVHLIGSGAGTLDRVVAITFTEKAAGELKSRVRDAIQSAWRDGERSEAERARFSAAIADMDRSTISTIHSFCTQLLRQRPVEAGVSPGFSVADEVESRMMLDEAWDIWKERELSRLDSPLRDVLESGARLEALRDLADVLVENRDLVEEAATTALLSGPLPDWREAFDSFCQAISPARLDEMEQLTGDCTNRDEDSAFKAVTEKLPALRRAAGRIRTGDPRAPLWALMVPKFPIGRRGGSYVRWSSRVSLDRLRHLSIAMNEAREEFGRLYRSRAAVQAIRSLCGVLEIYESIKAERGRVDFQDLLIRTRNLVRDHSDVRGDLRGGIRFLLIDEFQDTDPLQAEIVFLLAGEETGAPCAWDTVRIEPGRLVIVGDPKQSIYRFRRADIQVYERARKALLNSGGDLRPIRVNFRTRKGIAQWVNQVFDRLMPAGSAGGFRPAYSPLVAFRDVDENQGGPSVLRLALQAPAAEGEGARRRLEAATMAAVIRKRIETGAWTVFPKNKDAGNKPRPAGYGDVAVLFRALTGLEIFEDAFRDAGVPYRIEGGKYYFQRREVQSLLAVLRAIDSPNNRDSLVGALRSPFFGFDDETLLIAAAEDRLDYGRRGRPSNPELAAAFELLRGWHERRHLEGPSAIVEEILDRTSALEFFALQPLGHQRVANLLKVVDEARQYTGNGGTYRAFITHLSDREAAMETESESPVFEEDEGGYVQFLTIHAAKGLEFPVVIVADLLSGINARSRQMCLDREQGKMAFRLEGLRGESGHTPEWEDLLAGDKEQQLAEEIRLFYVATTRARDLLILPLAETRSNAQCFQKLLERSDWPPDMDISDLPPQTAGVAPPARAITPDHFKENPASLSVDRVRQEFGARRSALLEGLPAADRVIGPSRLKQELAEVSGASQGGGPARDASFRDSSRARALGSLVHAVLERVALDGSDADGWIDRLLPAHPPLTAADRADAARLVTTAVTHPVWIRARKASRVLRETPFFLKHADGLFVDGAVDLLFEEGEDLVVVDFKTDHAGNKGVDPLFEIYRGQGLGYALGVTGCSGRSVREVIFVFLDTGELRSLKVTAELLEEARLLIDTWVKA